LRGSGVSGTEGDLAGSRVAEFFRIKYLRGGGQTSGGFGVTEAAGWIEHVKVS